MLHKSVFKVSERSVGAEELWSGVSVSGRSWFGELFGNFVRGFGSGSWFGELVRGFGSGTWFGDLARGTGSGIRFGNFVRGFGSGKWFGDLAREVGSGTWFGDLVRELVRGFGSGNGRAVATLACICVSFCPRSARLKTFKKRRDFGPRGAFVL